MSEIKVNKISPKQTCTQLTLGDSGDTIIVTSGANFNTDGIKNLNTSSIITQTNATTITLGYSGSTIAIASGATQTGFGRTGTVNWDTTAKTANFTAVSGEGYFVNTTSGAITVSLPAGVAGAIISLADYTNTWQTNNVTINANGSEKIGGVAAPATLSTEGQSVTFIYVDSTEGWKNVQDSTSNVIGNAFVVATGGTISTCGNYKIHTFTGPGTFTVTNAGTPAGSNSVDYLVVAGGGAGGGGKGGGGGGAGGFRESVPSPAAWTASPLANPGGALPVSVQGYPITVGGGGTASQCNTGPSGVDSVFSTITSAGGGGGGKVPTNRNGVAGGSGGGAGGSGTPAVGGSGNTPPTSPSQGNAGGNGSGATPYSGGTGGGGGGAGAVGIAGSNTGGTVPAPSSVGGNGVGTAINNIPTVGTPGPTPGVRFFSGGGAGSVSDCHPGTPEPATIKGPAAGGGGIGGKASNPTNGTINTGGGGGGANNNLTAKSGGSGIVIIRYKFQ
jgi:hypothetical protein